MALWYVSAGFALAYAVLKGTLEEQELYLLLVPTIVVVVLAGVRPSELRTQRHRRPVSVARVGTLLVLAMTLVWSGVTYAGGRSHPDDGYARMRQYMVKHVPEGASVTSLSGSASLVLRDHYRVGQWRTPQERAKAGVEYVVVPWRLVEQGYAPFTARQTEVLTGQGERVFSFHGHTYGTVAVYRLPLPSAAGGSGD